jgi:tryptophanyl-tRNA synthetase
MNEGNEMGLIDYSELIQQFGSDKINETLVKKFTRVTGTQPHRFLRRGIVFSHRDLDSILTLHETGRPFFIHAGRGPSSPSMHLGHMANFEFAKWLSDVFKQPLLVMLSDGKWLPDVLSLSL